MLNQPHRLSVTQIKHLSHSARYLHHFKPVLGRRLSLPRSLLCNLLHSPALLWATNVLICLAMAERFENENWKSLHHKQSKWDKLHIYQLTSASLVLYQTSTLVLSLPPDFYPQLVFRPPRRTEGERGICELAATAGFSSDSNLQLPAGSDSQPWTEDALISHQTNPGAAHTEIRRQEPCHTCEGRARPFLGREDFPTALLGFLRYPLHHGALPDSGYSVRLFFLLQTCRACSKHGLCGSSPLLWYLKGGNSIHSTMCSVSYWYSCR